MRQQPVGPVLGSRGTPQSLHISAPQREALPPHSIVGGDPMWEKSISFVFTDLQGLIGARTGAREYKWPQLAFVWWPQRQTAWPDQFVTSSSSLAAVSSPGVTTTSWLHMCSFPTPLPASYPDISATLGFLCWHPKRSALFLSPLEGPTSETTGTCVLEGPLRYIITLEQGVANCGL